MVAFFIINQGVKWLCARRILTRQLCINCKRLANTLWNSSNFQPTELKILRYSRLATQKMCQSPVQKPQTRTAKSSENVIAERIVARMHGRPVAECNNSRILGLQIALQQDL
jgi:hypothetical protein